MTRILAALAAVAVFVAAPAVASAAADPAGDFTATVRLPRGEPSPSVRTRPPGTGAVTLRRNAIPPSPLVPRADAIVLTVIAATMVLEAAGIARLLQLRRRRRLRRLLAA